MKYRLLLLVAVVLISNTVRARYLQSGFDKEEYREMMYLNARTNGTPNYYKDFPEPKGYNRVYESAVIGLDNKWDFWIKDDRSTAVVSIRGTTAKAESWLVNFYAAMVPAKGELKVATNETFNYKLANDPRAAVHVGWLLSLAYLSKDMLPRIDSAYKTGTKEFLLVGHSQGGAIDFLLTAYLRCLQNDGKLPADIVFKTYCSAGPKPGNLYFAYEYESMTQNGWAFNVVNAADWVPETPISIQTVDDFNTTNPFVNAGSMIKKQKFPNNLIMRYLYNRLDKPTRRAQRNYEKYLGKMTSNMVRKSLKEYKQPVYFKSNNYVRTGTTITLHPDADYFKLYPNGTENVFIHHFHQPYLYLLERLVW